MNTFNYLDAPKKKKHKTNPVTTFPCPNTACDKHRFPYSKKIDRDSHVSRQHPELVSVFTSTRKSFTCSQCNAAHYKKIDAEKCPHGVQPKKNRQPTTNAGETLQSANSKEHARGFSQQCYGCGKLHYHAESALKCCRFLPVEDPLSAELASRFGVPVLESERRALSGVNFCATKQLDPYTARLVFKDKKSFISWQEKWEITNCIDYGTETWGKSKDAGPKNRHCSQLGWTSHCSRAGNPRHGMRMERHSTRKSTPSNCNCLSSLRFETHGSDSGVTVYVNAKHTHVIGLSGIQHIRLSEASIEEASRMITLKVADATIVRGMKFFLLSSNNDIRNTVARWSFITLFTIFDIFTLFLYRCF